VEFRNINCSPAQTGLQISIDRLNPGGVPCNIADYTNVFCAFPNNSSNVVWTGATLPNTTYYITTDGVANNQCAFEIVLNNFADELIAPTGISIENNNTCAGITKKLTPVGGTTGVFGYWSWYSDALCTQHVANGDTLLINPTVTTTYWLRAEGACDSTTTTSVVVNVTIPPQVTTYSPGGATSTGFVLQNCAGDNTGFGVTAIGNGLTYQWQFSSDAGVTWSSAGLGAAPYSGAASDSLSMSSIPSTFNGYRYRVIVSGTCGADTSDGGILNVSTMPVAVTQPASKLACLGSTSDFTASITATGAIDYAWEYYDGASWQPVSNGIPLGTTYADFTTSAISITTTAGTTPAGTYSYRVKYYTVCNAGSPSVSDSVSLTIQPTGTWTGETSTNWHVSANWCGPIPTTLTDVIIPSSPQSGNYPHVLLGNNGETHHLTLFGGSSVTIESGGDLAVSGNVVNNGQISVNTTAIMSTAGNFTNTATGTTTVDAAAELNLSGNLVNNGTAWFGAGLVKLEGTAVQDVGGSVDSEFGSMGVAGTYVGTAVTLNADIVVASTLNLLNPNGRFDLNGHTIGLAQSGSVTNEINSNRIFCSLLTGVISTSANLGSNTVYANIAGLGIGITTRSAAPGLTQLVRGHSQILANGSISIQRYFEIHPAINNNLNATLAFGYFEDELVTGSHNEADLIPWRQENPAAIWEGQFYPTRITHNVLTTTMTNWVTLDSIPAFSSWTLSDWNTEPLPIELLSFTATANTLTNAVYLEWITASETNCDYFTVERSANVADFEEVLTKDAAGNSSSVRIYNDADLHPLGGTSYYRLKQTDFNGDFTYSDVVPVTFNGSLTASSNAWINGDLNIIIQVNHDRAEERYSLRIVDATGKLVLADEMGAAKGVNNHLMMNPGLAPGIYMLTLESESHRFVHKLFIR